ncbi:ribonuclease Y [Hydrogenimonas sp.]|uniref:ribonuclease Y n=1 Tax=Hydrogenimonas sp. TaxID=2231112 RepID=UPI00262B3F0C|nr:ribonuclease Y [Hydrogenimonas sp.]
MTELIIGGAAATVSGVAAFFITKKIDASKYDIYVEQAKAKAKAIEHEAEVVLQNAKLKVKEAELEAKQKYEDELVRLNNEFNTRLAQLEKREEQLAKRIEEELSQVSEEKEEIKKAKAELKAAQQQIDALRQEYEAKRREALKILERASGLTSDEARELVLKEAEEDARAEIAHIVRKYETEAKTEAKRKANYILAQATTRYAGEFAAERLINVVHLPDDELKGRIIGKEGRNIKTLEMLLGVDIIIDDTPGAIILSSFNLYRRAIATRTIELLIEDGRIQPARIEEIYEKVTEEFEQMVLEEGEQIVTDLGVSPMHPELMKLIGRLRYRASYGQNALGHSLEVAHLAGIMAAEMGGDEVLAKRAGILHDIGKALTHEYAGSHVDLGAEVCRRYKEHPVVINAIYAHHGHEEPETIEAAAVCAADTLSAARPGARREVLESFLKRVKAIEEIAMSKPGVHHAYAINAGREVRVIVNATLVNDDEAILLSKEIAEEIEKSVQYPGEIKVNVIRETRAINYAR